MTAQTWTGGCHCQKVRFEVTVDASNGMTCNCSICEKKGTVLAFAPAAGFKLVSGTDDLSDYQFNKHVIHHLFCKHCGISSFGRGKGPDGTEMAAINLRCLDGIELDKVTIGKFDGKSR
jgi:hypothetical protein